MYVISINVSFKLRILYLVEDILAMDFCLYSFPDRFCALRCIIIVSELLFCYILKLVDLVLCGLCIGIIQIWMERVLHNFYVLFLNI